MQEFIVDVILVPFMQLIVIMMGLALVLWAIDEFINRNN